jgi:hypothetical protein
MLTTNRKNSVLLATVYFRYVQVRDFCGKMEMMPGIVSPNCSMAANRCALALGNLCRQDTYLHELPSLLERSPRPPQGNFSGLLNVKSAEMVYLDPFWL